MSRAFAALFPCVLAFGPLGCIDPVLPDDPGEDCVSDAPADPSSLPSGTVELGDVEGDTFAPWAAGQVVPIEFGGQGFQMITPFAEIPAGPDDASACWGVVLEHLDANGQVLDSEAGYRSGVRFERVGDMMRAGPFFDILDSAGAGDVLRLRVTVTSLEFVAVDEVDINLG